MTRAEQWSTNRSAYKQTRISAVNTSTSRVCLDFVLVIPMAVGYMVVRMY